MKIQTSELTRAALAWAVAMCEGFDPETLNTKTGVVYSMRYGVYRPSTDWAQGGPIIEREKTCVDIDSAGVWLAWNKQNYDDEPRYMVSGPTPLIAAMRCYVASKLGDEVDVPVELINEGEIK